ncbi:MAG: ATP-binding protein [Candidatus Methylacidiphilales bacterium]
MTVRGPSGHGKTYGVCDAVFRRLKSAKTPMTARYIMHTDIMLTVNRAIANGKSMTSVIDELKAVDILVIDEFGSVDHDMRDAALSTVRNIIFVRVDRIPIRTTFVITNKEPGWIKQHLDEPFSARLLGTERDVGRLIKLGPLPTITTADGRTIINPAGIGKPHRLPQPAWMADLQSVAADVTWSVTGEPKTLQHILASGKGFTWCLADRTQKLPAEAWEILRMENHPAYAVLEELRNWRVNF